MIKKIFLIFVLLLVAAAAFLYFFGSGYLNSTVKKNVEKYGPQMTQTSVTLEDVNLSVLSGKGSLSGLKIGNLEGYQAENILALGEVQIEADIGTVLSDKIIINKVYIKQPAISYERGLSGSNLKQLLDNIQEFTGPGEDVPEGEGPKKQVVIKELIIEEGTVFVGALGAGATVSLPPIRMTDIGEDNRQTIAQAVTLVLAEVLKAVGPALAKNGGNFKDTGQAILEGVSEDLSGKADKAIKDLFGK